MCGVKVKPEEEFAPLDKLHQFRPVIRLLNIPVLFRAVFECDGTKSFRLFCHPRLFQLPNVISPKGLYDVVEKMFPQYAEFDICYVDNQVCFKSHLPSAFGWSAKEY